MPLAIRGGAYASAGVTGGGVSAKQLSLNTIDSTNYPYTAAIVSGGLVVRGAGPIVVTARATMSSGTITAQLRIGGTTVATGNTALQSNITYIYNAHDGDQLQLWETDSGSGVSPTSGGISNVYIHYDVLTDLSPINGSVMRAALF
jgi:hypothetical protein